MAETLEWDSLRVFLACARAGSLRRASEALGVNHATVNRALSGLEARLGTRLFDRSVGGLVLTQPGEQLVAHAEAMERQAAEIGRKLTGIDARPSGLVRVALPLAMSQGFLAPILASFSRAFPEIEVEVRASNRIADLSRQEADVSIRIAHQVEDDVVGRRVLRFVVAAYATPAYLESHPGLASGDGTGAHWIGWGANNNWIATTPFPNARPRHRLPGIPAQIEAAAQGIGMAWVPCFLADPDPRLLRVPGVAPVPDRSIWVLLHDDLRHTARVRAFVDHAVTHLTRNRRMFTE